MLCVISQESNIRAELHWFLANLSLTSKGHSSSASSFTTMYPRTRKVSLARLHIRTCSRDCTCTFLLRISVLSCNWLFQVPMFQCIHNTDTYCTYHTLAVVWTDGSFQNRVVRCRCLVPGGMDFRFVSKNRAVLKLVCLLGFVTSLPRNAWNPVVSPCHCAILAVKKESQSSQRTRLHMSLSPNFAGCVYIQT